MSTYRALRTMLQTRGQVSALKRGEVRVPGCQIQFCDATSPINSVRRMIRNLDYDICELPIVPYLCARAVGVRITALPIFVLRGLHHRAIAVRRSHPHCSPAQLEGKVVAVNRGYTVTTGVWARAILQADYAVNVNKVRWQPTGDEHVPNYPLPTNVLQPMKDTAVEQLIIDGTAYAAVGQVSFDNAAIVPLLADPHAGLTALRDRSFYPLNHLVAVRDDVLEERPQIAAQLCKAFRDAKLRYLHRLHKGDIESPTAEDATYRSVMDVTQADPLPYGLSPNRLMLDLLVKHCVQQGILATPPRLEDLFTPDDAGDFNSS